MVRTGYSPSVRLFEAAACGSPIISDPWAGLESLFMPEAAILIAENTDDALRALLDIPETRRLALAAGGRSRALAEQIPAGRAPEHETCLIRANEDPPTTDFMSEEGIVWIEWG